jgi:polygalacturonase
VTAVKTVYEKIPMSMYRARDYGAIGDGKTGDTAAVQTAIDDCGKAGGGMVLLEKGRFMCGTLYLRSGVELHIAASAVLLASGDIAGYPDDTHCNRYANETDMDRCFIYAEDAENIRLTGDGVIDGNAECFPNKGSIYRPMMIRFLRCRHIRLENLRLYDSPAWTTAILDSEYIQVRGLDIRNSRHCSGDALDFDGCRHVFVSACRMNGTDDNLCLQASSKEYPVENIHISGCLFTSICAGIRIGLKSIGDIRNVVITNCTFHNIWREGIKIECTEGGSITDISLSSLVMRNVRRPLFILLNNRLDRIGSSLGLAEIPPIGNLERIQICGLIATDDGEMENTHLRFGGDVMGSPRFAGIRVDSAVDHPIRQLTLRDILYTFIGGVSSADIPAGYPAVVDIRKPHEGRVSENYYPDWSRAAFADIRNVKDLVLTNVQFRLLRHDDRPPFVIEGCTGWCQEEIRIREE